MKSLFLLAALAAGTIWAAPAENLLKDGGFESAKPEWRTWGSNASMGRKKACSMAAEAARTGKKGMIVRDEWDQARPYAHVPAIPVKAAPGWRLSFWAKAPKTQTFRAGIIQAGPRADGKSATVQRKVQLFTAGPEWKEYVLEVPGNPRTTGIGLLIGATDDDVRNTGFVHVDDVCLAAMPKAPAGVPAPAAEKKTAKISYRVDLMPHAVICNPARVEKTDCGYRLKPGAASTENDPQAAPDVKFTKVRIPRTGYYNIYIREKGPRCDAFGRVHIAGFPSNRVYFVRYSMHSGDQRRLGVYPLREGEQEIALNLPGKGVTLTQCECTYSGPRPLPKAMADYKLTIRPQGRPRLLINQVRLAELRRELDHPEMQNALQLLRAKAEDPVQLRIEPGVEVVNSPALEQKLIARAFFAMVRQDQKLAHETAQTMHRYFSKVTGYPGINYFYDIRDTIYAGAIVYDWCYDELTPEQRRDMIKTFYRLAIRLEPSWPPLLQPITIGHGNGGQITISPLAFAIACFDEDPEPFRIITCRVMNELVPMKAYEYRSPLHPQGSNYGCARLRADLFCATAYRIACGKDVFDPNIYRTHLYWQLLRLPDSFYFEEGDIWGFFRPPQSLEEALIFCGAGVRDPAVKGMFMALEGDKVEPLYHLLLNDTRLMPLKPREARLPYSYHFGPFHGSLIARTGFYGDEAAVCCHGGMKHTTNHQHLDAGAFQIWFRGLLAADIGEYQSSYGDKYDYDFNKRSIAHNMLRVYDPQEKFRDGKNDNDGGSRWILRPAKNPAEYENPYYDYGVTKSVSIGPDKQLPVYSVMTTDLTSAYSRKIKHYERTVVFLNQRDPERPASFIVLDLCETAKPEYRKIFQVSTYFPPVLKKDFIGLASENGGRADMKICFPEQAKITDFANEKAASNPFLNKIYELPIPGTRGHHAHRIEITPVKAQTSDTFLVNFGIRGEKAAPLAESYQDIGNAHLIRAGRFLVTLPKQAGLVKDALKFTVPKGADEVLCAGFAPGVWHAAGRNFTVKAGENTLFLQAAAGPLEVAPGKLAGAPEYQVPTSVRAAAHVTGADIIRDGKALPGKVKIISDVMMVPLAAFPEVPKDLFRAGAAQIRLNGLDIPLPVAPVQADGTLYVPAFAMGGVLHASTREDRFLNRVTYRTLPASVPAVAAVQCGQRAERLQTMIDAVPRMTHYHDFWISGKVPFTLIFDRPVGIGAIRADFLSCTRQTYNVEIEAGPDGKTFHKVFSGSTRLGDFSSVFRWKPEKMRALRCTFQNSSGRWGGFSRISFQIDGKEGK